MSLLGCFSSVIFSEDTACMDCRWVMSPIAGIVSLQEKLEGNLRYSHMRVRTYAEQVHASHYQHESQSHMSLYSPFRELPSWTESQFLLHEPWQNCLYLREYHPVLCLQIALWKGNEVELFVLQKNLQTAISNQQRLVMWKWLLSAVTHALDYAGAVLNFVCVALPVASGNHLYTSWHQRSMREDLFFGNW